MTRSHKSEVSKIKLVIAGDYQQYKRWLWFHKNFKGFEECRYVDSVDKLRGYTGDKAEIILEGEYWKNPAYKSEELKYLGTTHHLFVVKPKIG